MPDDDISTIGIDFDVLAIDVMRKADDEPQWQSWKQNELVNSAGRSINALLEEGIVLFLKQK